MMAESVQASAAVVLTFSCYKAANAQMVFYDSFHSVVKESR